MSAGNSGSYGSELSDGSSQAQNVYSSLWRADKRSGLWECKGVEHLPRAQIPERFLRSILTRITHGPRTNYMTYLSFHVTVTARREDVKEVKVQLQVWQPSFGERKCPVRGVTKIAYSQELSSGWLAGPGEMR